MSKNDFSNALADLISQIMQEMRPDNYLSMSEQEKFEHFAKGLKEQFDENRPVGEREAKAMLDDVLKKKDL